MLAWANLQEGECALIDGVSQVCKAWPWLLSIALGCTDADLYDAKRAPIEANRLFVYGRVCTEDPEVARFPVRVVLVADHAGGPLFSDFDPGGERVRSWQSWSRNDTTKRVLDRHHDGDPSAKARTC